MEIEVYLKNMNLKVTQGRIIIMKIFIDSEDVVTAEDIYNNCKEMKYKMNMSTIYRTLELFEKKDIIDKIDLGNGKYNYMFRKNSHKHILKCQCCHKEVEIDCPMQQIEEIIKSKTGFKLIKHDFEMMGICEECRRKQEDNNK